MTWPNGFRYDGMWENGEPIDKGKSLCPELRKCIESGLCTGTTTEGGNNRGQFMVVVTDREELYCAICAKQCCPRGVQLSRSLWFPAGQCSCINKKTCKALKGLNETKIFNPKLNSFSFR